MNPTNADFPSAFGELTTRSIATGLMCLAGLGAALFFAPLLWSQTPVDPKWTPRGRQRSPVERPFSGLSEGAPADDRGPRFGPPDGLGDRGDRQPATPGSNCSPTDVEWFPDATLYDATVLRTLFLDFEHDDWEAELADFKGSMSKSLPR